jgi:hypothetical protein
MFGQLTPAESRILVTLAVFREPDSGVTRLSYQAIMRYSGVGSRKCVSSTLKRLQRLHAIQISQGARIGITRECSAYRPTLEDPKFIEQCNQVYRNTREQIERERAYRLELRVQREKKARDACRGKKQQRITEVGVCVASTKPLTEAGGCAPRTSRIFLSLRKDKRNLPVKV